MNAHLLYRVTKIVNIFFNKEDVLNVYGMKKSKYIKWLPQEEFEVVLEVTKWLLPKTDNPRKRFPAWQKGHSRISR